VQTKTKTKTLAIVIAGVLLSTTVLHAHAVNIRVRGALYATHLAMPGESITENRISPRPIDAQLTIQDEFVRATLTAQANPFSDAVYTSAHGSGTHRGYADVSALTLLTFRPVWFASSAPLTFDYEPFGGRGSGGASATLLDLTNNQTLFQDDWYGPSPSIVGLPGLTLSPLDTYALKLYTFAASADDTTGIALSVTGLSIAPRTAWLESPLGVQVAALSAVPEPSSSLLLLAGLGVGLAAWGKRGRLVGTTHRHRSDDGAAISIKNL
jgi:hypothetical protein